MPPITPYPARPRNAFTLIEILVVVGLVGLLVALLIPAVQVVRGSAERTVCAGKLGQVGRLGAVWSQDNQGYTLPYYFGEPLAATVSTADEMGRLANCISAARATGASAIDPAKQTYGLALILIPDINDQTISNAQRQEWYHRRGERRLTRYQESQLYLGETGYGYSRPDGTVYRGLYVWIGSDLRFDGLPQVHRGQSNSLLVSGAVRTNHTLAEWRAFYAP